jgi:hypothetical protein
MMSCVLQGRSLFRLNFSITSTMHCTMSIRLFLSISLASIASTSALCAQDLWRMNVTDAAEPVSGMTEIERVSSAFQVSSTASSGRSPVIDQLSGWPKIVGGHGNFSPTRGLVFADLDNDGLKDVVMSSTDKKVYAWDWTGTLLPGFPVTTIQIPQYAPSCADLDGDGDLEIVQFTRGLTSGGRFYVIDHTGQVLPGFPISVGNNNLAGSPTLKDLDDDGQLEIIVPERAYPNGLLHVFELDGSEWGGNFPLLLDHVPTGSAAVGDVDADGDLEIGYLSYDSIYLWHADGTLLPRWPRSIPNANFSYQSPAFADLDGDGDLEIVVGAHKTAAGVYVFHHDGSSHGNWPRQFGTWSYCPPTVVDLDSDGELDIISGRAGYGPGVNSACFWAWNSTGSVRSGFPYMQSHGGGSEGPMTCYDLEGDGFHEIFTGHNIMEGTQGFLFGVDSDGNDLPGFPLRPEGFTYMNGAMIGDVDGDGDLELGVVSRRDLSVWVNLYDLPDTYKPERSPWPTYHQTADRGGLEGGGDKMHLRGEAVLAGPIYFTLLGDPGDIGWLWMSTSIAHTQDPFGWLHLARPFRDTVIAGRLIGADGQVTRPLRLPENPAAIGIPLYYQGLVGGRYTNLSSLTIW